VRRRGDGFLERVAAEDAAYHDRPACYAVIEDIGDSVGSQWVKLGKAAGHPQTRLRELQIGNPRRLALLAYSRTLTERQVHRQWRHLRASGKWFRLTPELLEELGTWDWNDAGLMNKVIRRPAVVEHGAVVVFSAAGLFNGWLRQQARVWGGEGRGGKSSGENGR
jgi:hypothetical protein